MTPPLPDFPLLSAPQRRLLARTVAQARRILLPAGNSPPPDPAAEDRAYRRWQALFLSRCAAAQGLEPSALPAAPPADPPPEATALAADLPDDLVRCLDAPGWMRQCWQSGPRRRRGGKVGAAELGAATQLFTEPYMVRFLLDNTLGAWWASRHPGPLPDRLFPFLRPESAAAGFPDWPEDAARLRLIDPCCGGGIFLVLALPLLTTLIARQHGIAVPRAVGLAGETLCGLDIDPHCRDVAAFSLAAAARRLGGEMPRPHLAACVPYHPPAALAGHPGARRLEAGFRDAALLGSLVDPGPPPADLPAADPATANALAAATLLAGRYHLAATNAPYLGRGKQDPALAAWCRARYPDADRDLATVFLRRSLELCRPGGAVALVLPQNWLYLRSYARLRARLIRDCEWRLVARLGEGGFRAGDAAGAFAMLFAAVRGRPGPEARITAVDAVAGRGPEGKAALLAPSPAAPAAAIRQADLAAAPECRWSGSPPAAEPGRDGVPVESLAVSRVGVQTGDDARFLRRFWEFPALRPPWRFIQGTPDPREEFAGLEEAVRWTDELLASPGARIQGQDALGRGGVAVHRLRGVFPYRYAGELFHQNIAVLTPRDPALLAALWLYASSPGYGEALARLDGKLNITNATLGRPRFDPAAWREAASRAFPHGLPRPWSNHPRQWIFHGHPCRTVVWDPAAGRLRPGPPRHDALVPHIALARLAGYRWPAELDPGMDLDSVQRHTADAARELNASFPPASLLEPADAAARLRRLLAGSYGKDWSADTEAALLAAVGAKDFETWIRHDFFAQHCRLFRQRPFLWHIWDGDPAGFAVLANYHALDALGLERLRAMAERRRAAATPGASRRAGERLGAALEAVALGRPPCDVFVRWKTAADQPRGWNPDPDDGVRINLRPFLLAPDVRLRGAGVLRRRPQVDWRPDRGRDGPAAPWSREFAGERRNDFHPGAATSS